MTKSFARWACAAGIASLMLLPFQVIAQDAAQIDSCTTLHASEVHLAQIYSQVLIKYKNDRLFVQKLKRSQQRWLAYRTAQIDMIFPHGPGPEYGSIYPTCQCELLEQLTADRIRFLDQWKDGIEEGDVCTGSRETQHP